MISFNASAGKNSGGFSIASPVIAETVETGLCIGCGICVALCPQHLLTMEWTRFGEYNPVQVRACSPECGTCSKICPFSDLDENEDTIGKELFGGIPEINHRRETGYYLNAFAGYSEKNRLAGSSGGIATWLLETILAGGAVDHVVCVAPTGDPDTLFSFTVFDTPDEVRAGAGSAYYPVEISGVIRYIIENPGRYAITGLPCFIKAIRLAQKNNKRLRERIVFTIGLVCGQMKSRDFTSYIADIAGTKGTVTKVRYRGKDPTQPAGNFYFTFSTREGNEDTLYRNDGIAEAWTNRWFTPNACNYCDDVFAECADVTCMDAWLPEYSKDGRGTSLVLVRSQAVQDIITRGKELHLTPIPIEKVIQSQAGVIEVKRKHLEYRLFLDRLHSRKTPRKRVKPEFPKNPFLLREIVLKDHMRALSRDLWAEGKHDTNLIRKAMLPDLNRLAFGRKIMSVIAFPVKILRNTARKITGDQNGQ